MSWINRTKKYFLIVLTTALFIIVFQSSSYIYNFSHRGDNSQETRTQNIKHLQRLNGKVNKGDNSSDSAHVTTLANIVLSVKEYEDLLSEVKESKRLLMERIWSDAMERGQKVNASRKHISDLDDIKFSRGVSAKTNKNQYHHYKVQDELKTARLGDKQKQSQEIYQTKLRDRSSVDKKNVIKVNRGYNEPKEVPLSKQQDQDVSRIKTKDRNSMDKSGRNTNKDDYSNLKIKAEYERKQQQQQQQQLDKESLIQRNHENNLLRLRNQNKMDPNYATSKKYSQNFNENFHRQQAENFNRYRNQTRPRRVLESNYHVHNKENALQIRDREIQRDSTVYPRITMATDRPIPETPGKRIKKMQGNNVFDELKNLVLGKESKFEKLVKDQMDLKNQDQKNSLTVRLDNDVRKEVCESCFANNFKYLINQENLCKNKNDIDLLILILTAPKEFDERTAIRETWGSLCNSQETNLACAFILGEVTDINAENRIKQESQEHKDIIKFDFKEAYANLTYKTLSGLRWAFEYCSKAKYVMKTDGDMYINTELIPIMLQAAPSSLFLGGFCWGISTPHRETDSKWYVSYKSYSRSKFPPMCSGTGYIMSMDVVEGILRTSKNIPFFHLEDVYTALCVQKLGVRPVRLQGFNNMRDDFSPCHYRNRVMTSHYVSSNLLKDYWTQSRTCERENQEPSNLYMSIPYPEVT